jgi:hypothetical protein
VGGSACAHLGAGMCLSYVQSTGVCQYWCLPVVQQMALATGSKVKCAVETAKALAHTKCKYVGHCWPYSLMTTLLSGAPSQTLVYWGYSIRRLHACGQLH